MDNTEADYKSSFDRLYAQKKSDFAIFGMPAPKALCYVFRDIDERTAFAEQLAADIHKCSHSVPGGRGALRYALGLSLFVSEKTAGMMVAIPNGSAGDITATVVQRSIGFAPEHAIGFEV